MTATSDAYRIAAEWHEKQARACDIIANDEPRIGVEIRDKAAKAAVHHRGSAAALRLAAMNLDRKEVGV